MVKTTCRLRMTWLVNHLYSSSCESSIRPSFWAPSLHWVIRVAYSSPSKRPGTWETGQRPGCWSSEPRRGARPARLAAGPQSPHHGARPARHIRGYLAVGQQGVHPLQEPRVQNVGLVHYERDLLVFTARTPQHRAEVFIEVLARVFPVDLQERGGSALFSPKELCA